MSDTNTVTTLERLANLLRIHSIESTQEANSGHPTSCSSMAEITSVLFFNVMRYDPKDPRNPAGSLCPSRLTSMIAQRLSSL
ncbi:unnamed protein product [Rotaria sp. Silwood2]|nr:unnamed protein product [Rotaria sp. Silwood2]